MQYFTIIHATVGLFQEDTYRFAFIGGYAHFVLKLGFFLYRRWESHMKAFRLLEKITQLKAARKSEVQITKPGIYCMYV
jgi:hypothetical protein